MNRLRSIEQPCLVHLLSAQGLQPGDRVMVQVDKSPHVLLLYLACRRGGFIYLPLNTAYRQRELEYFFTNAAPRVIICRPDTINLWQTLDKARTCALYTLDSQGQGTLFKQCREYEPDFLVANCRADTIAAILYRTYAERMFFGDSNHNML